MENSKVNRVLELMGKINNGNFLEESIEEKQEKDSIGWYDTETGQRFFPYDSLNRELEDRKDRESDSVSTLNRIQTEFGIDYNSSASILSPQLVSDIFRSCLKDRYISILSSQDAVHKYGEKLEGLGNVKDYDVLLSQTDKMYLEISGNGNGAAGNILELFFGKPGDCASDPDFGNVEAKTKYINSKRKVIHFSDISLNNKTGIINGVETPLITKCRAEDRFDELATPMNYVASFTRKLLKGQKDCDRPFIPETPGQTVSFSYKTCISGVEGSVIYKAKDFSGITYTAFVNIHEEPYGIKGEIYGFIGNLFKTKKELSLFGDDGEENSNIPKINGIETNELYSGLEVDSNPDKIIEFVVPYSVIMARIVHKMNCTFFAFPSTTSEKNGELCINFHKATMDRLNFDEYGIDVNSTEPENLEKMSKLAKDLLMDGTIVSGIKFVSPGGKVAKGVGIFYGTAMDYNKNPRIFDQTEL